VRWHRKEQSRGPKTAQTTHQSTIRAPTMKCLGVQEQAQLLSADAPYGDIERTTRATGGGKGPEPRC